jgi:ATP-dependent Lon protease
MSTRIRHGISFTASAIPFLICKLQDQDTFVIFFSVFVQVCICILQNSTLRALEVLEKEKKNCLCCKETVNMAAELLGGAVFGELLKVIENVAQKALVFKTKLKQIQETLESNIPILDEIKQLDEELDRRNEEIEKLMEVIRNGETLVLECSKIRWYHCWRRPKYTDKLIELERSINQFFQTVMPAQIARDTKEILLEVRGRKGSGSNGTIDGRDVSCAVPESLVNPVGLQVAIGELKMKLFKDGVSIVVLSAPPGCGKTTLARLLCHDKEVEGIDSKYSDVIM